MIPGVLQDAWQRRCRLGQIRELVEDQQQRVDCCAFREVGEEILPPGESHAVQQCLLAEVASDDATQHGELFGFRPLGRLIVDPADSAGESRQDPALAGAPSSVADEERRLGSIPGG